MSDSDEVVVRKIENACAKNNTMGSLDDRDHEKQNLNEDQRDISSSQKSGMVDGVVN